MENHEKAQLTIYLPQKIRTELQRLAAKRMLEHPQRNFSAGSIAVELLMEYLTLPENETKQGGEVNGK
jgi:hypothetical protein